MTFRQTTHIDPQFEGVSNAKLKEMAQEYLSWEREGFLPEDALLRTTTAQSTMGFLSLAFAVFREIAARTHITNPSQ